MRDRLIGILTRMLFWPLRVLAQIRAVVGSVGRAIRRVLGQTTQAILGVCRAIVAVVLWPLRIPGMIVRLIRRGLRAIWAWICAQGRMIRASPMAFYRGVIRRRDWVLAKIEYLQSESGKWKALFSTLKAPYSFLRLMGLSPQMATGLLLAGSTVGGETQVNIQHQPISLPRTAIQTTRYGSTYPLSQLARSQSRM